MSASTARGGWRGLWSARWVRIAAYLAALLVLARLALGTLLAFLLGQALEPLGLEARWHELDLVLHRGRAGVSWLSLVPRGAAADAPPLLELEHALLDLRLGALLRGRLELSRAEIDGLELSLVRDRSGHWNVEPALAALLERRSPRPARSRDETEAGESLSLAPPLVVEALRVQHLRLSLEDHSLVPPRHLFLEASARLSHRPGSDRPLRFSLAAHGGELLAGAALEGRARLEGDALLVECEARAAGLRPAALAPYLAALGLKPACESLAGELEAELRLEPRVDPAEGLETRGEREAPPRRALGGTFALRRARLEADGRVALALGALELELAAASARACDLARIELTGLECDLALSPAGGLIAGGFEIATEERVPAPGATPAAMLSAVVAAGLPPDLPHWIALFGRPDPEAYPWRLGRLALADGRLRLRDLRFEPAHEHELSLRSLALEELVHDPGREPGESRLALSASLAGVCEELRVDARLSPFAPRRRLALQLVLEGLGLAAAEPYLAGTGFEPALEGGRLALALEAEATTDADGRTRARLELEELALVGSGELLGLRSFALREIEIEQEPPRLRLGEVEVLGPRLSLVHDPLRGLLALGLRTGGEGREQSERAEEARASDARPERALPSAPPAGPVPSLEIGRFAWTDGRISFQDQSLDPPLELALESVELVLEELVLGGDPALPPAPPARLRASLVAPGLAERLALEGTLATRRGALDVEARLALEGRHLRGAPLAHFLRPFGVEPSLEDGRFSARAHARLCDDGRGPALDLALEELVLEEAGSMVAALEALVLDDLRAGEEGLALGGLRLVRPRLALAREREGTLRTSGLRLVPAPPSPAPSSAAALELPRLPAVAIGHLVVDDLRFAYEDQGLEPPLALAAELALELRDFDTRAGSGEFEARLVLAGVLDAGRFAGELRLRPESLGAKLRATLVGLRPGPLAVLLPVGLEHAGPGERLELEAEISLHDAPEGGVAARVALASASVASGEEAAWLALGGAPGPGALLSLERFDPAAGVLALGPTSLEGLELRARLDPQGALRLGGLRLAPGSRALDGRARPLPPAELPPSAAGALHTLDLGSVRAVLERLELIDERLGPDAPALVARATLELGGPHAGEPARLVRPEREEAQPLRLALEARVEELLESVRVEGELALFGASQGLELRISGSGLSTERIAEHIPGLPPGLAGTLTKGAFEGALELELETRRAAPADLGLGRPFALRLAARELRLRESDEGRVLLGLDLLELEAPRLDLARGELGIAELRLSTPRAHLARSARGLELAGFVLAPGSASDAASESAPSEPAPGPREPPAPAASPDGALTLGRLEVLGLDLGLEDQTLTPPSRLALETLELELTGLSTRPSGRPARLAARLAPRAPADGGSPLFGELALAGRLVTHPAPEGFVRLDLEGLELAPLSRLVEEQGLVLADGALDLGLELRLSGEGEGRGRARLAFCDLDLEEPAGGMLQRALSLPVTLEAALALTAAPDGTHRFSLRFPLDPRALSARELAVAGAGALAEVLAAALAAAPLKLAGAVLPRGARGPRESLVLEFAPASDELGDGESARLEALAARVAEQRGTSLRLRHEAAPADLARLESLANPDRVECLELVRGTRQRIARLEREIEEATRAARALLALGASQAERAGERLRALARELEAAQRAREEVLAILDQQAERQRARRTRGAALALAEARLAALEAFLAPLAAAGRLERGPVRALPLEELARGRVVLELVRR